MKNLKRVLSVVLAMLLILSVTPFAFAKGTVRQKLPLISLHGNGEKIYDKDGNQKWMPKLSNKSEDGEDSPVIEASKNILLPFLIEGLLQDKWDNYYDAIEKEAFDIFKGGELDENGNASNGSGIDPQGYRDNEYQMHSNFVWGDGTYEAESYTFSYDWRLDPWEIADQLHEYITNVMKATGKSQVCLTGRCLGTSFVMAYIAKYGTDHIKGISFDSGVVGGITGLSDAFCGNVSINDDAIERYVIDKTILGEYGLSPLIKSSLDLLVDAGLLDVVNDTVYKKLYNKLYVELTARLTTATVATWPGYWSCIKAKDYDKAINSVFGKEGSEKRVKYAGLIEKLDRYHNEVALRIPEILRNASENGTNICIIARYGTQLLPFSKESAGEIADDTVGLESATFGATTAKDIYSKLPDSYIKQQEKLGLGKYISADKQVDMSTCLFPDYTWVMKGVSHQNWTASEYDLLYTVCAADRQLTVDDKVVGWERFMVPENTDSGLRNEEMVLVPMTEENCNIDLWSTSSEIKDVSNDKAGRLFRFIRSLILFFTNLFDTIKSKLK